MNSPSLGLSTHALEIKPRLDQIGVALDWLRGLATLDQWPQRAAFGLILSADEALTNIVTYSFSEPADEAASIWLFCKHSSKEVALRIEDEGAFFDPTGALLGSHPKSIEDALPGGHGLRLMRHYLKSIHYAREGTRNVLTLVVDIEMAT
ncbi:ATP-binding protein [Ottowia thiooxydans]|uniref:ATP-binding protein n=1 Tax=Ottowia thiooxydans TaxID=219182 RepID=UPI0004140240|nr:ATP-binding protein [Ottowia thiooxydans]